MLMVDVCNAISSRKRALDWLSSFIHDFARRNFLCNSDSHRREIAKREPEGWLHFLPHILNARKKQLFLYRVKGDGIGVLRSILVTGTRKIISPSIKLRISVASTLAMEYFIN